MLQKVQGKLLIIQNNKLILNQKGFVWKSKFDGVQHKI